MRHAPGAPPSRSLPPVPLTFKLGSWSLGRLIWSGRFRVYHASRSLHLFASEIEHACAGCPPADLVGGCSVMNPPKNAIHD